MAFPGYCMLGAPCTAQMQHCCTQASTLQNSFRKTCIASVTVDQYAPHSAITCSSDTDALEQVTIVVLRRLVGFASLRIHSPVRRKQLEGGEALHAVLSAQRLVAIDFAVYRTYKEQQTCLVRLPVHFR